MTTPALRTVASRDMTTSGPAVEIRRASATRIDAPDVGQSVKVEDLRSFGDYAGASRPTGP